jgi:Protein of unknown function (DUF2909)
MKIIMVLALLGIIAALVGAGRAMLKRPTPQPTADAGSPALTQGDDRMARALAIRVGLSVTLFLLVLLAWYFGWIEPRGVPTGKA